MMIIMLFFFFFKQKTAYEMRISDWSSDVCSSDLHAESDARVFADMGLIDLLQRPGGPALSIMDSRIVTIWQQMRAEGYTEENGFPPTVVDFYAEPADKIAREESQRFVDATEGRMNDADAAVLFHAGIRHMIDFFGLMRLKRLMRYIHFDDRAGQVDAARLAAKGPPKKDG